MKKIAIVAASKDFRDEEYFIPQEVFEKEGLSFEVFSDKKGVLVGAYGGEGFAGKEIGELDVDGFSGIVFVGGSGAMKLLDNEESYRVVKESVKSGKILAAICISPVILAKAGVLRGKKVTVWSSSMDKSAIKEVEDYGGEYKKERVVRDGGIITGEGPEVAEEFAKEVGRAVKNLT